MDFTLQFLKIFSIGVFLISPLFFFLTILLIILGLVIGKKEKWSTFDAIYYAFVTATTVGYGDFRPKQKLSKVLSIIIAIIGLVSTGILISIGLEAVTFTFENSYNMAELNRRLKM